MKSLFSILGIYAILCVSPYVIWGEDDLDPHASEDESILGDDIPDDTEGGDQDGDDDKNDDSVEEDFTELLKGNRIGDKDFFKGYSLKS